LTQNVKEGIMKLETWTVN